VKVLSVMQKCAVVGLLAMSGCGGDEVGANMKVTGGVDPAKAAIDESLKKPVDKNDPNFEKMATPEKKNRSRETGASSGGATSSAIFD